MQMDVACQGVVKKVALGPSVFKTVGGCNFRVALLNGRVVKFVAVEHGAFGGKKAILSHKRLPVAETVQPALHPRLKGEEVGHGKGLAL